LWFKNKECFLVKKEKSRISPARLSGFSDYFRKFFKVLKNNCENLEGLIGTAMYNGQKVRLAPTMMLVVR